MDNRDSIIITSSGASSESTAPRYRLTVRFVGTMLGLSLIPLLVLGGLALRESGRQARDSSEALMVQGADGLGSQVDDWMDKNLRALQAASRQPAITSMAPASQEGVVKALQQSYPWMYLVFTVGMDGKSMARSDGKPNVDYSDRVYFRDVALLGKAASWQTLVGKTSGLPTVVMAVPIVVNGAPVGAVAAAMTTEDLSRTVATWRTGKTGYAYLLDEQGKVLSHPRKDLVAAMADQRSHPVVQAARAVGGTTGMVSFRGQDDRAMVGAAKTTRQGWLLGVEQAEDEVFEGIRQARLMGIGFLLVAMVAIALIAWRTARSLVNPIVKLTNLADRMSMGETDLQLDINTDDEIGMLAKSFDRLQVSLRKAMERLK